jgi:hypothetical protein
LLLNGCAVRPACGGIDASRSRKKQREIRPPQGRISTMFLTEPRMGKCKLFGRAIYRVLI